MHGSLGYMLPQKDMCGALEGLSGPTIKLENSFKGNLLTQLKQHILIKFINKILLCYRNTFLNHMSAFYQVQLVI